MFHTKENNTSPKRKQTWNQTATLPVRHLLLWLTLPWTFQGTQITWQGSFQLHRCFERTQRRTWMVMRMFFLVLDATATQASPRICLQVGITVKM